jgi:hypothetical protein
VGEVGEERHTPRCSRPTVPTSVRARRRIRASAPPWRASSSLTPATCSCSAPARQGTGREGAEEAPKDPAAGRGSGGSSAARGENGAGAVGEGGDGGAHARPWPRTAGYGCGGGNQELVQRRDKEGRRRTGRGAQGGVGSAATKLHLAAGRRGGTERPSFSLVRRPCSTSTSPPASIAAPRPPRRIDPKALELRRGYGRRALVAGSAHASRWGRRERDWIWKESADRGK